MQRIDKDEQLHKAERKQLQAHDKLLKEKPQEEKRVAREVAKAARQKEKEKEKTEQAAERERQ